MSLARRYWQLHSRIMADSSLKNQAKAPSFPGQKHEAPFIIQRVKEPMCKKPMNKKPCADSKTHPTSSPPHQTLLSRKQGHKVHKNHQGHHAIATPLKEHSETSHCADITQPLSSNHYLNRRMTSVFFMSRILQGFPLPTEKPRSKAPGWPDPPGGLLLVTSWYRPSSPRNAMGGVIVLQWPTLLKFQAELFI